MNELRIVAAEKIKVMYRVHGKGYMTSHSGGLDSKVPFDERILEAGEEMRLDALKDQLVSVVTMQ